MHNLFLQFILRCSLCVMVLMSAACSTMAGRAPSKADPYEGFNRSVDSFNQTMDRYVLEPVAKTYVTVLPELVRDGIGNFFSNLGDVLIAANNLLQGKPEAAVSDIGRFAVNTTVGVLGLMDIATPLGLPKHKEDFGQTLGKWGFDSGPYLVLPFFGPSSVRDAVGTVTALFVDPVTADHHNVPLRNSLIVLRLVDTRADLLELNHSLNQAALDKYAFVRDAYLANRRSLIYDGDPPLAPFDDPEEEVFDELPHEETIEQVQSGQTKPGENAIRTVGRDNTINSD